MSTIKSSKSTVHFAPPALLNLGITFSLEIVDLNVEFMKTAVGKVDSHSQVVPNVLKRFPIPKSSTKKSFFSYSHPY